MDPERERPLHHKGGAGVTTNFVPLSIRDRSRIVSWLWRHTAISYVRARRLARWLP